MERRNRYLGKDNIYTAVLDKLDPENPVKDYQLRKVLKDHLLHLFHFANEENETRLVCELGQGHTAEPEPRGSEQARPKGEKTPWSWAMAASFVPQASLAKT